MTIPFEELQKISPSAIVELYTIELVASLHGSTNIYRFHNGTNLNANGELIWDSNSFMRYPIECTGFEYTSKGTLPRPTLKASNAFSLLTSIMQNVNQTTAGNDLNGAKFTRIRSLLRYIDAANFSGGTNPFGTPDPSVKLPDEVYFLDRKVAENREFVQWEMVSAFDLVNVRVPKRMVNQTDFPGVGAFY
jgi:lambda family phage minor tail protein L